MSRPSHCEWCPFPGCDSCAYKGGENVTAQQDSGAQVCENGSASTEGSSPRRRVNEHRGPGPSDSTGKAYPSW